jgi:hypothetical protein
MKRAFLFAVPFVLALMLSSARAEESKEVKKDGEWTATVGCGHCNFSAETDAKGCCAAAKVGDKVYLLKGEVAKEFKKGGEWVIKGTISLDGKSIDVKEMKKKAS